MVKIIWLGNVRPYFFGRMTERMSEGLNPEEIKKLERQARELARDFISPTNKPQLPDSTTNPQDDKIVIVDPLTGKRTVYRKRGASSAFPAANIRSIQGQMLPYDSRPPSGLFRFKR